MHEFEEKAKHGYVSSYLIATIYAGLGEKNKVFELLEKAYDERDLDMSWHLQSDVRLNSLRSDPRFVALARRFGLRQQSSS